MGESVEDPHHVCGGDGLARLGSQCLQVRREHPLGAEQAFDAHRRCDVGQHEQPVEVGQGEDQLAEHAVRAVDECEALLLGQDDRFNAMRGESLRSGNELTAEGADVAFPDDRQRDVREGREVSGAAQAAVLVDNRRQTGGEGPGVCLRDFGAHTGAAGGQRRQSQQHHRPHDFPLDLRPRSRGVGTNQAALQLCSEIVGDVAGCQGTEAGGDAVRRSRIIGECFDAATARGDRVESVVGDHHWGFVACYSYDIVGADRADTHHDRSASIGCRHSMIVHRSQRPPGRSCQEVV